MVVVDFDACFNNNAVDHPIIQDDDTSSSALTGNRQVFNLPVKKVNAFLENER